MLLLKHDVVYMQHQEKESKWSDPSSVFPEKLDFLFLGQGIVFVVLEILDEYVKTYKKNVYDFDRPVQPTDSK